MNNLYKKLKIMERTRHQNTTPEYINAIYYNLMKYCRRWSNTSLISKLRATKNEVT